MKLNPLKFALTSLILMVLLAPNTSAADPADKLKSDNQKATLGQGLGPAKCIAKGRADFTTFLNGFIYSDGLSEGVLEPWKDITSRNQCQANDIVSLVKQRDKIKDQIRKAYLSCNTQQAPNLAKAFYRTNAEIYYVRHVVDSTIIANLPFNLLSTRMLQDKASLFYSPDKLRSEMKERYIGADKMSASDFDLFYSNLETKYSDKKDQYIICDNGSWKEVAKKFKEFIDNWGGTKKALNDASRGLGGRAEKLVEAATDQSFINYAKGVFQAKIGKLSAPAGLKDVVKQVNDNKPGTGTATQKEAAQGVAEDRKNLDLQEEREDLAVQFEILYKTTSDATNKLFMEEFDLLQKAITGSYKPLDELYKCTKTLNNKQCPSTK